MKWGDVPTWIMAIASAISLGALVLSINFNRRILKFNDDLLRQNDELLKIETNRDSQAIKVSSWATGFVTNSFSTSIDATGHTTYLKPKIKLIVFNASDQPIYNVVLAVYKMLDRTKLPDKESLAATQIDLVPPMEKWCEAIREESLFQLIPSWNVHLRFQDESAALAEANRVANGIRVYLTFEDASGRRWTRNERGKLESQN